MQRRSPPSFAAIRAAASPPWHKRQRQARAKARAVLRQPEHVPSAVLLAAAARLVRHHNSAVPKRAARTLSATAAAMARGRKASWACSCCGWHQGMEHRSCFWCDKSAQNSSPKPKAQKEKTRRVTATSLSYAQVSAAAVGQTRPRTKSEARSGWIDYGSTSVSDSLPAPPAADSDPADDLRLQCDFIRVQHDALVKLNNPLAQGQIEALRMQLKECSHRITAMQDPESRRATLQEVRDRKSNNYAKICVKRSEQLDLASQVLKQLQLLDQQAKTLKREVCDLEAQIKECEAEMPTEEDHSALAAAAAAAAQVVSPATLAAMASKMGLGSEMSARADMAGLIIRDLYELYQNTATSNHGGLPAPSTPPRVPSPASPVQVAESPRAGADMQVAELGGQLAALSKRRGAPDCEGPASAKRAAFVATIGDSEDEMVSDAHVYGRRLLAVQWRPAP